MNNVILAVKVLCLFVSLILGFTNIAKMMYQRDISSGSIVTMAAAMTGFISFQWLI